MQSTTCKVSDRNQNSVEHGQKHWQLYSKQTKCSSSSAKSNVWAEHAFGFAFICSCFQQVLICVSNTLPQRPLHLHTYPLMAPGSHAVWGMPSL